MAKLENAEGCWRVLPTSLYVSMIHYLNIVSANLTPGTRIVNLCSIIILQENQMKTKKVKSASKKTAKKMVKKLPVKIKRVSKTMPNQNKKEVQVIPVTDSTGVVVMRSVDDPGETTKNKVTVLKPRLDKETGVVTMVPEEKE